MPPPCVKALPDELFYKYSKLIPRWNQKCLAPKNQKCLAPNGDRHKMLGLFPAATPHGLKNALRRACGDAAACGEWDTAGKPACLRLESGLMVEFFCRTALDANGDVSPKMSPEMSPEIDQQILTLITNNPKISTLAMAGRIGVGKRTVLRHIDGLKTRKLVFREGPAKGGYWKIVAK